MNINELYNILNPIPEPPPEYFLKDLSIGDIFMFIEPGWNETDQWTITEKRNHKYDDDRYIFVKKVKSDYGGGEWVQGYPKVKIIKKANK